MQDTQSQLARLRRRAKGLSSSEKSNDGLKRVKVERRSASPVQTRGGSDGRPQAKPELLIPSVNPRISQPVMLAGSGGKSSIGSDAQVGPLMSTQSSGNPKVKSEKPHKTSSAKEDIQHKRTKRKFGNTLIFISDCNTK